MNTQKTALYLSGLALCLTSACSKHGQEPRAEAPLVSESQASGGMQMSESEQASDDRKRAEASFVAAPGIKLTGDAKLKEVAGGVQIEVEVENAPMGEKGIHIHQKGDCSDVRGKSMGEHYAGESPQHGLPTEPEHHLGDLGNIEIGQNGEGNLVIVVPGANLESGSERSFVGRAIVVHESRDIGTGPSGESGAPIACAVIKAED